MNLQRGRFNQFERLTQKEYLKLDKANRFEAFASLPEFTVICEERYNQIRNASHRGMTMERKTQTIHYRAGKGGTGPKRKIRYATYWRVAPSCFFRQ